MQNSRCVCRNRFGNHGSLIVAGLILPYGLAGGKATAA